MKMKWLVYHLKTSVYFADFFCIAGVVALLLNVFKVDFGGQVTVDEIILTFALAIYFKCDAIYVSVVKIKNGRVK